MPTVDLTNRNFGLSRYNPKSLAPETVIDARGAVWSQQTTKAPKVPYPIHIELGSLAKGIIWRGGAVVSLNRYDIGWRELYDSGNSGVLLATNTPGIKIVGFRAHGGWDGFRPRENCEGWHVSRSWFSGNRDDGGVESDHLESGKVEDCLCEELYTFMSARPGKSAGDPTQGITKDLEIDVVKCVISLGGHPLKQPGDAKRLESKWAKNPGHGQFIKSDGAGRGLKLRFKDNVVRMDWVPNRSTSVHAMPPENCSLTADSGNNVLVWLGGDEVPGIPMETVDGVRVPKSFRIGEWNQKRPGLWRVTKDKSVWTSARSKWLGDHPEVFRIPGIDDGAGPPPPPDPDPDPDPADPKAQMVSRSDGGLTAWSTAMDALRKQPPDTARAVKNTGVGNYTELARLAGEECRDHPEALPLYDAAQLAAKIAQGVKDELDDGDAESAMAAIDMPLAQECVGLAVAYRDGEMPEEPEDPDPPVDDIPSKIEAEIEAINAAWVTYRADLDGPVFGDALDAGLDAIEAILDGE